MRKSLLNVILFLILLSGLVLGTQNSVEKNMQNRFSILYTYHFNDNMNNWYLLNFPHLDIKMRMSNYKEAEDSFSLVGKIGLQGLYAYLHFGPEARFLDYFFANATLGIYAGYIGIGILGETEIGIRKNIFKKVYVESIGVWQVFLPGLKIGWQAPSIKLGIGIEL